VRRYARRWRKERDQSTAAAVPLSFAPGEADQFDWSYEIVLLSGVTVTVKAAQVRLRGPEQGSSHDVRPPSKKYTCLHCKKRSRDAQV